MGKRPHGDRRTATSTDAEIGRRIRARRAEIGMSQTALADAIGVTFQQIQKYEKGQNRVAVTTLIDIAETLSVSLLVLLPRPGKANPELMLSIDEPESQEIARAMSLLNKDGRRVLVSLARVLTADEQMRRKSSR